MNKKRKESWDEKGKIWDGGGAGRTLRVDGRNGHPGGLPSNTPTKTQQLLAGRGKRGKKTKK